MVWESTGSALSVRKNSMDLSQLGPITGPYLSIYLSINCSKHQLQLLKQSVLYAGYHKFCKVSKVDFSALKKKNSCLDKHVHDFSPST